MASIFTYDHDPPKVSSPWSIPRGSSKTEVSEQCRDAVTTFAQPGILSDYGVTKLEAEPQEGPTEYKLHLLLRPRRSYKAMTTVSKLPEVSHSRSQEAWSHIDTRMLSPSPVPNQPRQQRLLHLTTQLLWRLQQSSPYHTTSSRETPLPKLPGDGIDFDSDSTEPPAGFIPGLEESRGALYEIGVSDDGTLVGLAKDEMDESINTLRIMARSLGCVVEVRRMVVVGDCEWVAADDPGADATLQAGVDITRHDKLWVAEAFVTPDLGLSSPYHSKGEGGEPAVTSKVPDTLDQIPVPSKGYSQTPQLRVTLTGPTMSGKSTLLGTLSTGTLDNGRGKSRLSLLRHRHEVLSGVTSSIAQELIGYRDETILNFSQGNIESWTDIHDCAEDGRLVFVSDCGGHPRYRRTVLRGLMSWAPHWSILCIAADGDGVATNGGIKDNPPESVRLLSVGVDFVKAHLTLALNMNVPMAVVVTKFDLASKASLQKTLSKILTAVKDSGRMPKILQPDQKQHDSLRVIPSHDYGKAQELARMMAQSGDLTQYVPILITSAVKGVGIGLLHALLASLPLPPAPTPHDFVGMALNPEQPKCLFHIDDTFNMPDSYSSVAASFGTFDRNGIVVSGYMRFGSLSIGDDIVVGPFTPLETESSSLGPVERGSPGSHGFSISHPSSAELARLAAKNSVSASATPGEWHTAKIVSIRNLRLPVRCLEAGQAGSVGLFFKPLNAGRDGFLKSEGSMSLRVRRGMVIAIPSKHMMDTGLKLQAASGFTATFLDHDLSSVVAGSYVNVYIASVRATARVKSLSLYHVDSEEDEGSSYGTAASDIDDVFTIGHDTNRDGGYPGKVSRRTEVILELLNNREWVELGCRVILLEGGNQFSSGLEGFVGNIVEITD